MKTYEKTHPWISFEFDLSKANPRLWISLGEAASKCDHVSKTPLRPSTSQKLHKIYLAKGIAATTAIEGNTLSAEEVEQIIEGKLTVPPSKQYQQQEVENILGVYNEILSQISQSTLPPLSRELISSYNQRVLDSLQLEEGVVAGQIRKHSVVVGRYRGAPAQDLRYLLDRLCNWLNGKDFEAQPGMEVVYAIIKAIVAHLYIAWIHPFGDGNGRTARLLELYILLSAGVPSPVAHLLSNHYNQTRSEYYRQLDIASKSGGDILPFLQYAVVGLVDQLRSQIDFIWEQQWDITWRSYISQSFQNKTSLIDVRRRDLLFDLSSQSDFVSIAKISELSPRVARAYAGKTLKTIQRDIKALEKMGLVIRRNGDIGAHKELVFSFLPTKRVEKINRFD